MCNFAISLSLDFGRGDRASESLLSVNGIIEQRTIITKIKLL